MPAQTNSERIDSLLQVTSVLDEHMKQIDRDLNSIEKDSEETKSQIHHLDIRIARIEEGLKHIDKEVEKLRLSRYEFGKLFFAALLGGGITFGITQLNEWLKATRAERQPQTTKKP